MKKRLYVITIIITMIMSMLAVNVNAADEKSLTVSMEPSEKTVEKGKEFTVDISVSNIKAGDNGINSLSGYIEFDEKVFEDLASDSFEGLNDWTVKYSEDTGKITLLKTKFVKEDEKICQVTLKTKSSTTSENGVIELTDLQASNSADEISADDISLKIAIGEEKEKNDNTIKISSGNTSKKTSNQNTNNSATQIIAGNTKNNTNSNTNTNKNTNKNDANKTVTNKDEMPDTGIDDTVVQAILLVVLVAGLGYIRFKSTDKK